MNAKSLQHPNLPPYTTHAGHASNHNASRPALSKCPLKGEIVLPIRIKVPRPRVFKMQAWHIFDTVFTLVCMVAVALLFAILTTRLSIHASVEEVPNVSGLTMEEAQKVLGKHNLNFSVENRFYSATVPSGHVLSQSPAAGIKVRSGWHVRITESTGPQKVSIPDTSGMSARDAAMAVRRSLLELGTVAHLPAPGQSELVLAQTPPPNAEGVDKPQVSVLLSAPEAGGASEWVMPALTGLSLREAQKRAASAGLKLVAIGPAPAPSPSATGMAGNGLGALGGNGIGAGTLPGASPIPAIQPIKPIDPLTGQPAQSAPAPPRPASAPLSGTITAQTPQPGFRITGDDTIKVYLNGARPGSGSASTSTSSATQGAAPTTSVTVPQ